MIAPLRAASPIYLARASRSAMGAASANPDSVSLHNASEAKSTPAASRPEPSDSAVFYQPQGNSLKRVLKVPVRSAGPRAQLLNGGEEPLYLLTTSHDLQVLDRQGRVAYTLERPEGLRQTKVTANGLLLHSTTKLQLHDPNTGKLLSSRDLAKGESQVFSGGQHTLLLAQGKLQILDSQLATTREFPVDFKPSQAKELPDGTVVVAGREAAQVFNAEGQSIHRSDARYRDAQVLGHTLHLRQGDQHWTRIDLRSGAEETIDLGHHNYDLTALPDGRVLGREQHDLTRSTYRVYRTDGSVQNTIDVSGKPLKTLISKDGKSAYVLSRRWMDEPKRQTLYRLDLTQQRDSLLSQGFGRLADRVGLVEDKQTLHETEGDRAFRLAQLADGKLAVAGSEQVTLLTPRGETTESFADIQDLVESRPSELWPTGQLSEQAGSLEEELRATESWSDYVSLAPLLQKRGAYRGAGSVEFSDSRSGLEAYKEMGYDKKQMMDLITQATLMPDRRTRMRFPGPGSGVAEIKSDREGDYVVVETRDGEKALRTKLFLDDFSQASSLIAMRAGERHLVAVGDHYGSLYIFEHGKSSRPLAHYRLQNQVEGLTVNPAGKLLAFTSQGEVLSWSADQKLATNGSNSIVDEALQDEIEFEENSIKVGDFDLERFS